MKTTYNFKEIVNIGLLIANIILLGFNTHFLCTEYPRNSNLGFDYMGVIVGLLALLIGFLVAWQIYKTIDVDKKLSTIEFRYKSMVKKEIDKATLYTKASTEFVQGISILSNMYTDNYAVAYEMFAISLLHYIEAGIDVNGYVNDCISNMEESLKKKHWDRGYNYERINNSIRQIIEKGSLKKEMIDKIYKLEMERNEFLNS